jgi:hypothetical protein
MKKLFAILAVLSIAFGGFMAYTVKEVVETLTVEAEKNYTTEYVMVQSHADEGFLNAKAINPSSQLEYGYILDDKYELGDIVEITYDNDDLMAERKVTGKELNDIEQKYYKEINALMEEGIALSASWN